MNWKYSSTGVRSIATALRETGRAEEVLALVTPETRHALERPRSATWHDGSVVVDVSLATQKVLGDEGVEAVYFSAVRRGVGPILEPFIRVALALSGGRLETLFESFNEHLKSLMQGVKTQWEKTGPSSGVLTVVHEDPMKPVAFPSWRGSLRYAFLLAGVEGELVPRTPSPDDLRFTFDVRWKS